MVQLGGKYNLIRKIVVVEHEFLQVCEQFQRFKRGQLVVAEIKVTHPVRVQVQDGIREFVGLLVEVDELWKGVVIVDYSTEKTNRRLCATL